MFRQLFILLITTLPIGLIAADAPPKVFIDKGACPFECCTYREWTTDKDTDLFDMIDGKKKVGMAKKGEKVTALTGEVHTIPH